MKRLLGIVAVVLIVFFVVTQPQEAADMTRNGVTLVGDALQSLVTYFTSLFA